MIISTVAPVFERDLFGVSKTTQSMSQEASMLGVKPGELPYGRLHINSDEMGLWMTTNPILANLHLSWNFMHEDVYAGEVQGWRFRPSAETLRTNPELEGYDLLIIND